MKNKKLLKGFNEFINENAEIFVSKYQNYVAKLYGVVDEKYFKIIEEMENIDPHDLCTPNDFITNDTAMGIVFNLFLDKIYKK